MKIPHFYLAKDLRENRRILISDVANELRDFAKSSEWTEHFRTDHHNKKWFLINIKSKEDSQAIATRGDYCYADTLIKKIPLTISFLDKLFPSTRRVRLMKLEAGGKIYWHYDSMESADFGVSRIHLPIQVNSQTFFQVCWEKFCMLPEKVYYADFSFPHRVVNYSDEDVLTLIIDYEGEPHPYFADKSYWKKKSFSFRRKYRFFFQLLCDMWCMHRGMPDIKRFISLYLLKL